MSVASTSYVMGGGELEPATNGLPKATSRPNQIFNVCSCATTCFANNQTASGTR
jgi:hypothetical protein